MNFLTCEVKTKIVNMRGWVRVPLAKEVGELLQTKPELYNFVNSWDIIECTKKGENYSAFYSDPKRIVVGFRLIIDSFRGYVLQPHVWNFDYHGKWYDHSGETFGTRICLLTTAHDKVRRLLYAYANKGNRLFTLRDICQWKNEKTIKEIDQISGGSMTISEVLSDPQDMLVYVIRLSYKQHDSTCDDYKIVIPHNEYCCKLHANDHKLQTLGQMFVDIFGLQVDDVCELYERIRIGNE